MKNTLISILVIIILLLGFFFIKEKNSRDTMINEWPETVPATPTNNNQQSNSNPCSPSIVVSAPAAGASYTVGQQVTIEWTTCNVQKVLIGLVSGGKDHGYITQNPISVSTGSYQWTATNPGKDFTDLNTNNYQIVVESEDGGVMAKSGTFSVTTQQSSGEYKNDQVGFSFDLSGFGNQAENFTISSGDTGKMFFGHLVCDGGTVCVRFGGITEDFTAPMDGESYLVKKFPDTTWLQQLSQNGYTNEIKTNSKGEQYVLVYGKKEVDMPYIGEDQMLAVFKLKSSSDNFKAIGFHFYYGNPTSFLNMIDSVDIY